MRYKITKQYTQYAESLCAEFFSLDDARAFVNKSQNINESINVRATYWIFDNEKLISELDNELTLTSQYANGNMLLPHEVEKPFNVMILDNNLETTIAKFANLNDAKIFIEEKLYLDADNNVDITYFIFDGEKFIEKFNKNHGPFGEQKEKKKVFRPTPLPNKPRLGPGGYWVDEDEDKDKNR